MRKWTIARHNGGLRRADGGFEHRPELEEWLRVVHNDTQESMEGYEEFAVAAGDAARLVKLLNRLVQETREPAQRCPICRGPYPCDYCAVDSLSPEGREG